jgi:ABC-type transport system substrate-binding protein
MQGQMTEMNRGRRKLLYDRVQEIVSREAPMIFLVSPHVVVAQSGRIGNFRPAIMDHQTLWNVEQLFLKRMP